jgi:uncharacterized protein (DUF3084 family)
LTQGINIARKWKRERTEVQVALDRNPVVKRQLELGNVEKAVEQLNTIIHLQAEHIDRQEVRIGELEKDNSKLRSEVNERERHFAAEIKRMEEENLALLEQVDDLKGLLENREGRNPHE